MAQQPSQPIVRSYLKRKRWSDHGKAVATSILNRWCRFLDDQGVADILDATGDECADYLAARLDEVSSTTAHKDYQHLVWFYEWAVREGEIDTRRDRGPMHNIAPPKVAEPDPDRVQHCTREDYDALMASFKPRDMVDCRNAAMISLMYRSGLRCSEIARCDRERMDLASDAPWLEVLGKNGRWRKVPVALETAVLIERYLRRLGPVDDEALFVNTYNGTKASAECARVKPLAIQSMLKRRCAKLGINVTAHQFRRSFAVEAKRRGLNDTTIMAIADWADSRMLDRYQRAERQELAAAEFHRIDDSAPRPKVRRRLRAVG